MKRVLACRIFLMAQRTAALSSTIRMQLRCTTGTVIIKLRMLLAQVNTEFVVSNTRKSTSPKMFGVSRVTLERLLRGGSALPGQAFRKHAFQKPVLVELSTRHRALACEIRSPYGRPTSKCTNSRCGTGLLEFPCSEDVLRRTCGGKGCNDKRAYREDACREPKSR